MIKEFEFYHGAVLTRLIHLGTGFLSLAVYPTPSNASYVLSHEDQRAGLYIKHSAKRMSPWRFSLQKVHQDEIQGMKNELGEVFLLLVCGDDGVVVLNFKELKKILDEVHEGVEWISVGRGQREEYAVKGSNGKLSFKVSKGDFPKKIFGTLYPVN